MNDAAPTGGYCTCRRAAPRAGDARSRRPARPPPSLCASLSPLTRARERERGLQRATDKMIGPFAPDATHLDGAVGVSVGGQLRCGAVVVTARLALSIASCFLVATPLNEEQQVACLLHQPHLAYVLCPYAVPR